jgi:DNA-binding MarR family transcriptional regulator
VSESTPYLPTDRLAIGQILVRLLHRFRMELFAQNEKVSAFPGIRFSHLSIWGNVGTEGIRLTDLADRANLSMAACSELVNELEDLGYVERRPDPSDGRAKLIFPSGEGRQLLDAAGREVAALEQRWRRMLPAGEFDVACRTFDRLIEALELNGE